MFIFRLKITVSHLHAAHATAALTDFLNSVQDKYGVHQYETLTSADSTQAEAILALPFADRERIRIDFNIFAAQFEADHPEEKDVYFKLESV